MSIILSRPKIIVIVGATASGKTALAIKIAQKFNGEIISADSCQIYCGMDIGTGKVTKAEQKQAKHWLINIVSPKTNFSAAQFKKLADKKIEDILKRGKLPIVVGGSGLYIKSIIDNLEIPEVKPDLKLREKLEKEIEKYGLKYVFDKLIKFDPEAAYIVDPKNPRRVIRALEVAIKTKKPFSAQRKAEKPFFDFIEIGINKPKKELENRINKRVNLMIKEGLIKEVENLAKRYDQKQQSFDTIGYREIIEYLNKKISLDEAIDLIKKNTRQYAKRQMTWFKKDKRIHWIKNKKEAKKLVKEFLKSQLKTI